MLAERSTRLSTPALSLSLDKSGEQDQNYFVISLFQQQINKQTAYNNIYIKKKK